MSALEPFSIRTMNSSSISDQSSGKDRQVFTILLSLYFLVLFPILRADRYYNDDLKRALFGRTGWDSNGRPLTTLLMKLLQCYDHALVDISPLPQIGGIAILAWVGVLIARRYSISSPWIVALLAFPLGAQPFYLENLSYKFDALSMSLALLLALLPIVALRNDRKGWWLGVLSLFASLNLYQPAINAYLVFFILDIVLAQLQEKTPRQVMSELLSRAAQAGLAMLIYQLIVGTHLNGWVKRQSETIHSLRDLPAIKTNFVDFCNYVGASFGQQWWLYFAPILVVIAFFPVVIGIRYALKTRHTQPVAVVAILFIMTLFLPVIALACVLGPMLLLAHPPIAPRVLVGVGALLTAALIVVHAALGRWRRSDKWVLSVACVFALGMCSFASAYGNALGEQKRYEERIAARLADDLADLGAIGSGHSLLLDGAAGYSPITAHVAEQFPLVRSLVPTYISGDDMFHTHIFLLYYIPDMEDLRFKTDAESLKMKSTLLARTCEIPAMRSTQAYNLYVIDGVAVVVFRSAYTQRCAATTPVGSAQ